MSQTQTAHCSRCRQPLADGTTYCVACGCNNEGLLDAKISKVGSDLETRATWNQLCRFFPFLLWFSK
jgi:uncharacterized Zn finger protein (UPF0148 family)